MAKSDQEETIEEGRRGLPLRLKMKTRVEKNLLLKETQNAWLQWRKKKPTVTGVYRGSRRWSEIGVNHVMRKKVLHT